MAAITLSRTSRRARTSRGDRPVWKEAPSPAYQGVKGLVVVGISLVILIPLLIVVSTSLADDQQIIKSGGYVLWPTHPTLKSYETRSPAV